MSWQGLGTVILGLGAAFSWGAADFAGGLATRRARHPSQVSAVGTVIGGQLVGLLLTSLLVTLTGEAPPSLEVWVLAGTAGLAGGWGLTLLYRALALDQMSLAAPISAVIGAAVPVSLSLFLEGWPKLWTAGGLALALVSIWLIARSEGPSGTTTDTPHPIWRRLRLPIGAGIIFGAFFVLLHQASQESLLWPVLITRLTSVTFLTLLSVSQRRFRLPSPSLWPLILVNGALDTTGNALFVLAGRMGRLDIAAVLSSLYPASTVLLARFLLNERLARRQSIGILAALLAIVLITL